MSKPSQAELDTDRESAGERNRQLDESLGIFPKAPECAIKCQGYVQDFCCGQFCERLLLRPKK